MNTVLAGARQPDQRPLAGFEDDRRAGRRRPTLRGRREPRPAAPAPGRRDGGGATGDGASGRANPQRFVGQCRARCEAAVATIIASRLRITTPFPQEQLCRQFPFCSTCRARSSPDRDRLVCGRPRRARRNPPPAPRSPTGIFGSSGLMSLSSVTLARLGHAANSARPDARQCELRRSALSSAAAGTRLRSVNDTLPISLASATISPCFGVTSNVAVCATTASPGLPSSR